MSGVLLCGLLSLVPLTESKDADRAAVWLHDHAAARAKALKENKPLFVVFR
jgi:hypothetical protein